MAATFTGSPETFERDSIGTFTDSSFPPGWSDAALVSPESIAPEPSAVVIRTSDAFGLPTKALATLPSIAESQGIYRPIDPSNFYKTQVDVRIDQFSDIDPAAQQADPNHPGFLVCGCPVGTETILDAPINVLFAVNDGETDLIHQASFGMIASAETQSWHLLFGTTNVLANIDLGGHIEEGKWYTVETDFDATAGALHAEVIDATTGLSLIDKMVFVTEPKYSFNGGKYDPSVDGVFNTEAYIDGEVSLVHHGLDPDLNKPGLAVIDNIDSSNQHPATGNAVAWGLDRADQLLDGILSDFG
jgi:hypothetical protein